MIDSILAALPGDFPWQNQIHWFDTIDSTNTRAKAMARQGAPHGTILIADRQTGGRGRLGRGFHSPAGMGIYMSVLLRPQCPPEALMHLTCAAAVSMCDAVEEVTGIRPGIKWSNDLVIGHRKLAGILTELTLGSHSERVDAAVVGIGINCCQAVSDFPPEIRDMACSLEMALGSPVERAALAGAMIRHLYRMDNALPQREQILTRYRRDCVTLGQEISIAQPGLVRHGTALDVDGNGALLVRLPDGQVEAVNSGEVSIRGMYGYL